MSGKRKIRAVTFDVGHTLIEPGDCVGQVYAQVAAKHGHANLSATDLKRRFHAALQARGGAVNTWDDWARIADDTFAGLVAKPPSETFFPELFERYAQPSAWRIYGDVQPVLDALSRRGVKVGIISNWDDRLRPLLAALKLDGYFQATVISCEVGASKPAPETFAAAVKQLGLAPETILHVGDSFEMDVAGARAAGLNAVQIEREAKPLRDGQIASLLDLLAII